MSAKLLRSRTDASCPALLLPCASFFPSKRLCPAIKQRPRHHCQEQKKLGLSWFASSTTSLSNHHSSRGLRPGERERSSRSVGVMAAVMEKEGGVTKAAAAAVGAPQEDGVKKAVGAPEEAVLTAPEKEPAGKCYKKTVGEEATFLETAKDYLTQFKDRPAKTHWICFMNRVRAYGEYVSQKSSSVFGKQKVEPVIKEPTPVVAVNDGSAPEVANKDGCPVVADKPAAASLTEGVF
ncbi:hypothetical protein EJB05_04775, partial [Eragrostis curvula]